MTTTGQTTAIDIDAIRARDAHVIAGPWTVGEPKCVDEVDAWEIPIRLPSAVDGNPDERSELAVVRYQTAGFQYPHAEAMADAEFIAHAREDIPALLDEIDRLSAELDEQDAALSSLHTDLDFQTKAAFDNQAEANRLRARLERIAANATETAAEFDAAGAGTHARLLRAVAVQAVGEEA